MQPQYHPFPQICTTCQVIGQDPPRYFLEVEGHRGGKDSTLFPVLFQCGDMTGIGTMELGCSWASQVQKVPPLARVPKCRRIRGGALASRKGAWLSGITPGQLVKCELLQPQALFLPANQALPAEVTLSPYPSALQPNRSLKARKPVLTSGSNAV